jgi:prepilin-type N-terminal cleavage/methylation domain-containing protein
MRLNEKGRPSGRPFLFDLEEMRMAARQKGFTLVELMIVVAIIGVLAAVAIPKFADMLEKSREGATKGNLGAIKSAIAGYYADQTVLPATLDTQSTLSGSVYFKPFLPNYIEMLPSVKVTAKSSANGSNAGWGPGKIFQTADDVTVGTWDTPAFASNSAGFGWRYNSSDGNVWVNSKMLDMNGKSYTIYGFE